MLIDCRSSKSLTLVRRKREIAHSVEMRRTGTTSPQSDKQIRRAQRLRGGVACPRCPRMVTLPAAAGRMASASRSATWRSVALSRRMLFDRRRPVSLLDFSPAPHHPVSQVERRFFSARLSGRFAGTDWIRPGRSDNETAVERRKVAGRPVDGRQVDDWRKRQKLACCASAC